MANEETAAPERAARVHIVGGSSFWGSVSVCTSEFEAKAYAPRDEIVCAVTPMSKLARGVLKNKHRFIPRTLRFVAFFVGGFKGWNWALAAWFLIINYVVYVAWPPPVHPGNVSALDPVELSKQLLFFVGAGLLVKKSIGPWHAAEHMAIAAYERSGSTELADIRKENRVDPHCGGRFFLPILLKGWLDPHIAHHLGIPRWIVSLLMIELVLQMDAHVGFDRLPIFKQASHLLQRYVTTSEPEEIHLLTAQTAIRRLLYAHSLLPKR